MTGLLRRTLLALCLAAGPAQAQDAAEVYGPFVFDPRYPAVLILTGEIGPDDTRNFREALFDHQILTLVLNSPGGAILPALEIAAITSDKGFETVIPENATCASACAFVFLAGQTRHAEGRLGVHQFYATEDGLSLGSVTRGETQDLAGTIIRYLDSFDTPAAVYIRMLGTPPDGMYWFTPEELAEEGIVSAPLGAFPVIAFGDYPVAAPLEVPPVTAAEPTAVPPPDPDPGPVETAPPIEPAPPPAQVSEPSFDCARAGTPTERAICADPDLGDQDARMAGLYRDLRAGSTAAARQRLLDDQRAFLRVRDGCGSDAACLFGVYDLRVRQLLEQR